MPVLSQRDSTQLARQILVEDQYVVDVPEGWQIVKGRIRKGDRKVNCILLRRGKVQWELVPKEKMLYRNPDGTRNWYCYADAWGCVIREISNGDL